MDMILINIDGLKNCTSLTELNIIHCGQLTNIDGLKNCTSLSKLTIRRCGPTRFSTNVHTINECLEQIELYKQNHDM